MLGYFARPVALLLTTSMAVNAADLPVKAPPPVPVPAPFNWTGFYVGANIGEGWSSNWGGTADPLPSPAVVGISPLSFSNSASGIIGGGQIGYNWQFNPRWLIGLETDFQGAHLRAGDSTIAPLLASPPTGLVPNSGAVMSSQVDWFGTVRGRLGLTFDRWLVYGTGGFAYAKEKSCADSDFPAGAGDPFPLLGIFLIGIPALCAEIGLQIARAAGAFDPVLPASISRIATGWTAGGGVEYALPSTWGNWSIRAEYLFVDLGGESVTAFDVTQSS
jgi:outer membrane immunogenic protein